MRGKSVEAISDATREMWTAHSARERSPWAPSRDRDLARVSSLTCDPAMGTTSEAMLCSLVGEENYRVVIRIAPVRPIWETFRRSCRCFTLILVGPPDLARCGFQGRSSGTVLCDHAKCWRHMAVDLLGRWGPSRPRNCGQSQTADDQTGISRVSTQHDTTRAV